jgi:hypothetical protein
MRLTPSPGIVPGLLHIFRLAKRGMAVNGNSDRLETFDRKMLAGRFLSGNEPTGGHSSDLEVCATKTLARSHKAVANILPG